MNVIHTTILVSELTTSSYSASLQVTNVIIAKPKALTLSQSTMQTGTKYLVIYETAPLQVTIVVHLSWWAGNIQFEVIFYVCRVRTTFPFSFFFDFVLHPLRFNCMNNMKSNLHQTVKSACPISDLSDCNLLLVYHIGQPCHKAVCVSFTAL